MGCGCNRGMVCCAAGRVIMAELELEMRKAMLTGSWASFDFLRSAYERHMRGEPAGKAAALQAVQSGFDSPASHKCKQSA